MRHFGLKNNRTYDAYHDVNDLRDLVHKATQRERIDLNDFLAHRQKCVKDVCLDS